MQPSVPETNMTPEQQGTASGAAVGAAAGAGIAAVAGGSERSQPVWPIGVARGVGGASAPVSSRSRLIGAEIHPA